MYLYRIGSCKYIQDMSGNGGLYASGRWHNKGTRIIYFSEHISLAKLEVLANSSFRTRELCLVIATAPADITIEEITLGDLPEDWNTYPYPEVIKRITTKWISSEKSVIMKVPSAQSDHEYNYLVNPLHQDIKKIKIDSIEEVKFDQRLHL